jgi:hypothetical protein
MTEFILLGGNKVGLSNALSVSARYYDPAKELAFFDECAAVIVPDLTNSADLEEHFLNK